MNLAWLFIPLTVIACAISLCYVFYGSPLCLITGGHKPKKRTSPPYESVCENCRNVIPD